MENVTINKVAEVTIFFWILKIFATTLGETAGDMLSMTLNLGYAVSLGFTLLLFLILVGIQLRASKHYAFLYWPVIIATTTLGTEISDFMDRSLGFGYMLGSFILFACLIGTLLLWEQRHKKITVYPISTWRVEIFYWTAILFSNSLGTAFGDFLSDNLGLGYIVSSMITASIILIVVLLHFFTKINHVFLFWLAFIFTRPFGATFGDFLTKPEIKGGLGFSTITSTIVTAVLFIGILMISLRKKSQV